jgi:two-component system nitrogen regulation sensor histidine kinase NtrY
MTLASADAPAADFGPAQGARDRLMRKLGTLMVVLALMSGVATFAVLTGLTPLDPSPEVVTAALLVNLGFVLVLAGFIAREGLKLVQARRRGKAAARLHVRIVGVFAFVAVLPAVLVAITAIVTLDRGLDHWFSTKTRGIIENSKTVAEAYVREHGQVIRSDIVAMGGDVERAAEVYGLLSKNFLDFFNTQAALRALPGAYLIREDGTVVLRAGLPLQRDFARPPPEAMHKAKAGEAVAIAPGVTNLVGAVLRLRNLPDLYLYVSRPLNPEVIRFQRMTEAGVAEYANLEARRFGVQVAFALMYLCIALIVLVSAIWLGLSFANHFVSPIRRLIAAADEVSRGNFNIRLPVKQTQGDLANLAQTFNTMAAELRQQRQELLNASDMIDRRRRFTEAVLAGVTAGVVGVDPSGGVTLANRSALRLLRADESDLLGRPLMAVLPEIASLVEAARESRQRLVHGQVTLRRGDQERIVSVRVASEQSGGEAPGLVVTLDDITDLVTAQRTSAWADVARRIAHEIKNPLTPIQLSAERLKRRYLKVLTSDREIFEQCTETIVRQVGDIRRMVDEFSSFARMPKPVLESEDLVETVKQAVFLQQVAHNDLDIVLDLPEKPLRMRFDRRLISQALTNVAKNAIEAVQAVPEAQRGRGRVEIRLRVDDDMAVIDVADNGAGFPSENRQRLLEPYITTRESGTGLGLAIVRKIMEEHGGRIELLDGAAQPDGRRGALVRLNLPLRAAEAQEDREPERVRAASA